MANMLKGVRKNMQEEEASRTPTGALTGEKKITPKMKREVDVYNTAIMKLLHDKSTRDSVLEMLKSAPVEQSLPATAIQVNDQIEQSIQPNNDIVLAGSVALVGDLIEISEAAGLAQFDEAKITQVYQDTLQKYIENGVKSGKIDPVQLQSDIEPLMSDEQKAVGRANAQERGMPMAPTSGMATSKLVDDTRRGEREKYQAQQGMLSNMAGQAVPGNTGMGGI